MSAPYATTRLAVRILAARVEMFGCTRSLMALRDQAGLTPNF